MTEIFRIFYVTHPHAGREVNESLSMVQLFSYQGTGGYHGGFWCNISENVAGVRWHSGTYKRPQPEIDYPLRFATTLERVEPYDFMAPTMKNKAPPKLRRKNVTVRVSLPQVPPFVISDDWSGPIPIGRAEIDTVERFFFFFVDEVTDRHIHSRTSEGTGRKAKLRGGRNGKSTR